MLSNVSKIFERILYSGKCQIIWIPSFPSITVELGKDIVHNDVFCPCLKNGNVLWIMALGLLLTNLSKAFDCLSHERLLAKLHAYGFSSAALRLIHSYLANRKHRTKANSSYSSWEEIGPRIYNIRTFIIQYISLWQIICNE